jgi:hypothetical protein
MFRQQFGEPCGYQFERHTQTIPFQITDYEEGALNRPLGTS